MENNLIKMTYDFAKKYLAQYIFALTKPLLVGILGLVLFSLIFINQKFVLLALLSIPCLCYSFWRGFVVTYFLCDCANGFQKGSTDIFDLYVEKNKNESKKLAGYVVFVAILTILLYIPSLIYISNNVSLNDLSNVAKVTKIVNMAFFVNTIVLAPFLNYALQAFYFKKNGENYFKLFLNCYSKLDLKGILIALIITIFMFKLAELTPVVYVILALLFNPFIYGINTFWYAKRVK